jgi:hypothetical protein
MRGGAAIAPVNMLGDAAPLATRSVAQAGNFRGDSSGRCW